MAQQNTQLARTSISVNSPVVKHYKVTYVMIPPGLYVTHQSIRGVLRSVLKQFLLITFPQNTVESTTEKILLNEGVDTCSTILILLSLFAKRMEISQLQRCYSTCEVILEYSIITLVFGCLLLVTMSLKLLKTTQNGWNLELP